MIFKIFGIGKDIHDAKKDPSGFMAEKIIDVIRGVFMIWKIVIILPFIPLIIFGFTDTWGGPYPWVRAIALVWAAIMFVVFFVMRLVVRVLHKKTRGITDSVVGAVKKVVNENDNA